MSTTYRGRLDVVSGCLALSMLVHALERGGFLSGRPDALSYPEMTTTLGQHFLMVPLTLFTLAVPLPFGALGRHRAGRRPAFQAGRAPRRRAGHDGFSRSHVQHWSVWVHACICEAERVRELTEEREHMTTSSSRSPPTGDEALADGVRAVLLRPPARHAREPRSIGISY